MEKSTMDQDSRGRMVIIAGSIGCAIATTATTLRLITRIYITHQVGPDDWLAVVALICTYGMAISQTINALKCLGQHEWEFDALLDIPGFFETFWITSLFYNASLLFIKLTVLFQSFRVFRQIQSMRTAYIIAMVLVTGWNLGQLFAVTFKCLPVAGFWDRTIDASCTNGQVGVYINAAGNMITDVIIIVLPLPALWQLHLPTSQKIAVLGVFGIGSITLIISMIRLTTIHVGSMDDFTYDTWMSACFSVAELTSGITCAAVAALRPLVSRLFPSVLSLSSDSTIKYDPNSKSPPTIGSGHSCTKDRGRLSSDEKAWTADVYDAELGSWAYSVPGTPRMSISGERDQELRHKSVSIRAFQMMKPEFGSTTSIMSPRPDGRLTFLDMDETPHTPLRPAIMIERDFEVRSSEDLIRDTKMNI